MRFSAGSNCPGAVLEEARQLFDEDARWAMRTRPQRRLEQLIQTAQNCGHELRCYDDVW